MVRDAGASVNDWYPDMTSELSAMGPVQFSRPRGVAEKSFTKPGFWEHFVDFSQEKQQNTEFTKFSLVRTPQIY